MPLPAKMPTVDPAPDTPKPPTLHLSSREISCPVCKTVFVPTRKNRRYCSSACRGEVIGPNRPEMLSLNFKRWYDQNKSYFQDRHKRRWEEKKHERMKPCIHCGKVYLPSRQLRRFCSKECSRNRYLQQKKDEWYRRKKNPTHRINDVFRQALKERLSRRRIYSWRTAWQILGYSPDDLRRHLERYFTKQNGFTWENYGKLWQVDHVIPLSWHEYTSVDDPAFKAAWALTNLKPEYATVNHKKKDRYAGFFDSKGQLQFIA